MENTNSTRDVEDINIKEILLKYIYYWKWFVLGAVISLFAAYSYLRYAPVIFQTTAKIKILDNSKGGMKLPSDVTALFSNSKVNIDNEIEVLKSHRLLSRVALALDLTTSYYSEGKIKSSELWKNKPFKVIWLDAKDSINSRKVSFDIALQSNGFNLVSEDKVSDKLYPYGQKNSIDGQGFMLVLEDNFSLSNAGSNKYKVTRTPLISVVQSLSNALLLASTGKMSEVLSMGLTGENYDKSEAVIDAVIDEFNRDGVTDRQLISQRTIDFVN